MSYNQQRTIQTTHQPTTAFFPDDYPKFTDVPCRKVEDADRVFFPNLGDEATAAVEARKVCRGCAFQQACAEYALTHDEVDGFWGGLTPRERRAIRRRRAA